MGLDSIEIILEVEEHYGISVPDADAERCSKVGDLAGVVWGQLHTRKDARWTREHVEQDIRQLIAEFMRVPVAEVQMNTRFVEDLGVD